MGMFNWSFSVVQLPLRLTHKVRPAWNQNQLFLACCKEDAMRIQALLAITRSALFIMRRYPLPGTFSASSQPWRLGTPAPAKMVPILCGPWRSRGSRSAGVHVWEASSECCVLVCLETSLLPFGWKPEVKFNPERCFKRNLVWCVAAVAPHQELLFPEQCQECEGGFEALSRLGPCSPCAEAFDCF